MIDMNRQESAAVQTLLGFSTTERASVSRELPGEQGPLLVKFSDGKTVRVLADGTTEDT
jgi:hypothetical protein